MRLTQRHPRLPADLPKPERVRLPPGPRFGASFQTAAWITRPGPFMQRCQRRYGDAFTLRIHNERPWVILADPEHIKSVFGGDPAVLCAGEANTILRPVVGRHSVVVLDEPAHLVQRKLMLPMFHGEQISSFATLIGEVAAQNVAGWPRGEPLELWPRMQEITLDVIVEAVFGSATDRVRGLRDLLRETINWATDPRRLGVSAAIGAARTERIRSFRRRMADVDAAILNEIRTSRAEPEDAGARSILAQLVRARYEDGSAMSDGELRDELITLLVVGHETTASALAWAFERLVRHPDVLASLRGELQADGGRDAASKLKSGSYLDAVIRETLRLRPVLPIVVRMLRRPIQVGDHHLPAGVGVAPSIYLAHRREEVYPDPAAFRPERFLGSASGTYTFIPFGGGTRRCLGASFAMMEMSIVIATVVRMVDLVVVDQRPERPVRRSIALAPSRGAAAVAVAAT